MSARFLLLSCISLLLWGATGCCVRQGAHSVNRLWMDWDTYCGTAYCMETIDHLPYHKERIGYFRWQYNKDPGHQYAKLGPLPPRPECDPDCPCIQDIQGQGGGGIPRSTDSLWQPGVPQPVDESVFLPPVPPPQGFAPQTPTPALAQPPGATSGSRPASAPNVVPPPSLKLPADSPSPYYGPTAQRWGGFISTGQPTVPPSATANRPAVAPSAPDPSRVADKSSMPPGEWLLLH
ncbi:MAG: hypothetical protein AB7O26_05515 [Planctomycetaceae bacterium]